VLVPLNPVTHKQDVLRLLFLVMITTPVPLILAIMILDVIIPMLTVMITMNAPLINVLLIKDAITRFMNVKKEILVIQLLAINLKDVFMIL
jgi:hypothetical protein